MEEQVEKIRPQVGVGVFVFKEGKVLLGKRKGIYGAGHWAPPGGHLEFGESLEACAIRELAEETGLKALSLKTGPWSQEVMGENRHYVIFPAIVDQFTGELQLLEPDRCEEWQWFGLESLPSPLLSSLAIFFENYKRAPELDPHKQVLASLLKVYQDREWGKFHSPKNLVMDLASEVGELLDLFRWMSEEESYQPDPKTIQEIRDEVGDIFNAVLYFSHKLNIDPIEAAYQKLEKLKQKYPVDLCRGKALKYTAYETL